MEEMKILSSMAGYRIVKLWKSRYPHRLGRGLVAEIASASKELGAGTLIFYGEIQPSSAFQVMRAGLRIVDRVGLILEIFAKHAGTKEALLQIEMAKIRHEIPLVREQIRRSKLGELPGFLGPGGYAIDAYYRRLTNRLARLRRELEELRKRRKLMIESRRERGLPHIALVGYASAGKTSIFNAIAKENMRVGEEYFTTLHPKHKAVRFEGREVVLIDTIGFIRDIPPQIIEAFNAVLEEMRSSDVIIFVVDASEKDNIVREKVSAGIEVLSKIGALGLPMVVALNKIDKLSDIRGVKMVVEEVIRRADLSSPIVPVSATRGDGLRELMRAAIAALEARTLEREASG